MLTEAVVNKCDLQHFLVCHLHPILLYCTYKMIILICKDVMMMMMTAIWLMMTYRIDLNCDWMVDGDIVWLINWLFFQFIDWFVFKALTELVRLTNEVQINAQTEETGDLFMWLKHQASQGVLNAQVRWLDIHRLLEQILQDSIACFCSVV